MAKVTEYTRITKMKDNDILLVDGPDGTRTILQTDASKQMGGEVIMVNETAGDSTKVVINTTGKDIELALMADLAPVVEDISDLKTQTNVNMELIPLTFTENKVVAISSSKIAMQDGIPVQADSGNFDCAVASCNKGDKFIVTGKGGSTARLWLFADAEGNVLISSASNAVEEGLDLVTPYGAAWFVINNSRTVETKSCFKGQTIKGLNSELTEEDNMVGGTVKGIFSSDDFEFGKFNTASGSTGSSAAGVIPENNKSYTVLGIRSKSANDSGFIDSNIKAIESMGSIYLYVIGVNASTGVVDGSYNVSTNTWNTNGNKIPVSQKINLYSVLSLYPDRKFKLCIVDISTENQITVSDALQNVRYYYSASKETIGRIDERIELLETGNVEVPSYFVSHLAEKTSDILANMEETGRNGFTFAFLTDLHWSKNNKNSPKLLSYIMKNVAVNNVVCGGDLIDQGTKEQAEAVMLDCINSFKKLGITFPVCYGNHDGNWNPYADQREHPERKFSEATVWALMEAQYDKYCPVYWGDGFNFYIDYPETNTRLIFIDTGDTREIEGETGDGIYWRDYEGFADALMDANGKNIIVIAHAVAQDSIGTRLCRISNAYNDRANYSTDYFQYDFTNATGHVYLVIGGHGHSDSITTPVTGGISWVMTDTDSNLTHNEDGSTAGTITEQAFDVITVDYTSGNVKLVRIGRGSNRQILAS